MTTKSLMAAMNAITAIFNLIMIYFIVGSYIGVGTAATGQGFVSAMTYSLSLFGVIVVVDGLCVGPDIKVKSR